VPTVENLQRCEALNIDQSDIVALQGPFSEALNRAIYDHFSVDVLVTKESGAEEGVTEKVKPALERGTHAVIIRRPQLVDGANSFVDQESLVRYLLERVQY